VFQMINLPSPINATSLKITITDTWNIGNNGWKEISFYGCYGATPVLHPCRYDETCTLNNELKLTGQTCSASSSIYGFFNTCQFAYDGSDIPWASGQGVGEWIFINFNSWVTLRRIAFIQTGTLTYVHNSLTYVHLIYLTSS